MAQSLPQFLGDVRGQRGHHQDQRLGQGTRHVRQPGGVRGQLDDPRDRGVVAQHLEISPDGADGLVQQPRGHRIQ